MLKSAFLNVCLVTTSLVSAQDAATPKINWMTWSEAIEAQKAAREFYLKDKKANHPPKKIFLDVYTTWCGPCKKMDANTFKKPSVIQAITTNEG